MLRKHVPDFVYPNTIREVVHTENMLLGTRFGGMREAVGIRRRRYVWITLCRFCWTCQPWDVKELDS